LFGKFRWSEGVNVPEGFVMVRVEVAVPLAASVTEGVPNLQLAPVGNPLHVSCTVPLKPFCDVTVTVEVAEGAVLDTVKLVTEEESEKFGNLLIKLPMFTEPKPVARSNPGFVLKPERMPIESPVVLTTQFGVPASQSMAIVPTVVS
jgi:hypothetical protein